MSQPLVSIVVPVYRGMPHLTALIHSLTAQTYPNIELQAAVTPTGDGSEELLESAGFEVKTTPEGTGASSNWTIATQMASGEFIKLICQDDVLYPTAIEQQVQFLLKHPTAVMAVSKRDIIDSNGKILFRGRGLSGLPKNSMALSGKDVLRSSYLHGGNIFGEPLAVMFRRIELLNSMPWRDDNPLMLDLNTYTKVAPQGDVVIDHESLGAFRVSESSWSTQLAKEQLEQTRTWQREYESQFPVSPIDKTRAAIQRHIQTNTRRAAYSYLRMRGGLS